jgi:hypothetical protein
MQMHQLENPSVFASIAFLIFTTAPQAVCVASNMLYLGLGMRAKDDTLPDPHGHHLHLQVETNTCACD